MGITKQSMKSQQALCHALLRALGLCCVVAEAVSIMPRKWKTEELDYELDSLDHVMDQLRCDTCRAGIWQIWKVSIEGNKVTYGLATHSGRVAKHWTAGPEGIIEIIQDVTQATNLPQRYVGMKSELKSGGGREYYLRPLINMAGALDSTRIATGDALGPMGKEIRDDNKVTVADDSTRPKFAMYKVVNEVVDKVDIYELAKMIYQVHARSFGSSGLKQFLELQEKVCVQITKSCDAIGGTAPWHRERYNPGVEPVMNQMSTKEEHLLKKQLGGGAMGDL